MEQMHDANIKFSLPNKQLNFFIVTLSGVYEVQDL